MLFVESFYAGGDIVEAVSVSNNPKISVGSSLGRSFERMQEKIRERAYHLFSKRSPEAGDAESDWLYAQAEILAPVNLELSEQKSNIVVSCDLTGFKPGEIEIEVEGDTLKILGSHKESRSQDTHAGALSESRSMFFFHTVQLPCSVDVDKASAELQKNDHLKVKLPKKVVRAIRSVDK
jgi:HSP20 family protein